MARTQLLRRKGRQPRFRHNLRLLYKKLDKAVPEGAHAHHVFPNEFADQFAGKMNIHDPRLGAFWEAKDHLSQAKAYNKRWGKFLEKERNQQEMLDFGRKLSGEYGLDVDF